MSPANPPPSGREAIVRSLIDAATGLFAEKGLRGVSVRDIGQRAGLNHTLINRYFGSRENLVQVVLHELTNAFDASAPIPTKDDDLVTASKSVVLAFADNAPLWRTMAHALLDNDADVFAHPEQAGFKRMVMRLRQAQEAGEIRPDVDAGLAVLLGLSTVLGWLLLETRFERHPPDDGLDIDERRRRAHALWWSLLQP